jgi:hypothetical protein
VGEKEVWEKEVWDKERVLAQGGGRVTTDGRVSELTDVRRHAFDPDLIHHSRVTRGWSEGGARATDTNLSPPLDVRVGNYDVAVEPTGTHEGLQAGSVGVQVWMEM